MCEPSDISDQQWARQLILRMRRILGKMTTNDDFLTTFDDGCCRAATVSGSGFV
jgi:hypothetical protein